MKILRALVIVGCAAAIALLAWALALRAAYRTTSSGWRAACCVTPCASRASSRSTGHVGGLHPLPLHAAVPVAAGQARRRLRDRLRARPRRLAARAGRHAAARLRLRAPRRRLARRGLDRAGPHRRGLRAHGRLVRPRPPRHAVPVPGHRRSAVRLLGPQAPRAIVAAALLMVAAFFTKQTASPFMVASVWSC